MNSTTLSDLYQVSNSDQPVKLKIEIGYGHNANTKLILDHTPVPGPGPEGSFVRSFETLLGANRDLFGKDLLMTTVVMVIPDLPKTTSLKIGISGGVSPYAETLESNETEEGGVVTYGVNIRFYK